jgi:hypothetical protein
MLSRDASEPFMVPSFLNLPTELRYLIYGRLLVPAIPTSRSNLTAVNWQVRKEVHAWLANQKLTVHIKDPLRIKQSEDPGHVISQWDKLILQRVRNIKFEISELPTYFSHPMINLLCRLWREECHLEQVTFTVLDESRNGFPNSLPAASKELLCECLLHPIKVVVAMREVQLTRTPMTWKQPDLPDVFRFPRRLLVAYYSNDRAVDALLRASAETITPDSDKVWMLLVSAVRHGHRAIIDVLSDAVTVDLKETTTSDGETLLIEAARYGDVQIMDKLLRGRGPGEIKGLINLQDRHGETAFFKAVTCLDLEMVSYLLEKHADPNVTCIQASRKHWRSESHPLEISHNFPNLALHHTYFS